MFSPETATVGYLALTFDRNETRRVKITVIGGSLRRIAVPTGGDAQAVRPRAVRAGAMGDSWIADARYALMPFNYSCLVGEALEWAYAISGQGGTGVVANGPSGSTNFQNAARLQPFIDADLDYFVLHLSINDIGAAAGAMQTGLASILDQFASGSPTTRIFVVGPQIRYSRDDPDAARMAAMEAEATAAVGSRSNVTYISPRAQQWFYGTYQGRRSVPVGDGNVDWMMWDDAAHPTQLGSMHMAVMLITQLVLRLHITQAQVNGGLPAPFGLPLNIYPMPTAPADPVVPLPEGTFFEDDFNRADAAAWGTTSVGGLTWGSTGSGITRTIVSNKGRASITSGTGYIWVDAGQADGVLRAEIAAVGGTDYSAGVCFRHVDGGNTFLIQRTSSGSPRYWRIIRRVSNVETVLATTAVTPTNGDQIRVELDGSSIEVFINNVSV